MTINLAAARVAEAQHRLETAKAIENSASYDFSTVKERISDLEHKREHIRSRLKAGELSDREAGGLLSDVAEDLNDLQGLEKAAVSAVKAAFDDIRAAEAELRQYQNLLETAQAKMELSAIREHIAECENALLETLKAAVPLLQKAGRAPILDEVWKPGQQLAEIISTKSLHRYANR